MKSYLNKILLCILVISGTYFLMPINFVLGEENAIYSSEIIDDETTSDETTESNINIDLEQEEANGDNTEALNNLNNSANNIDFYQDYVIVKGIINDNTKVYDVIANIGILNLENIYNNISISIIRKITENAEDDTEDIESTDINLDSLNNDDYTSQNDSEESNNTYNILTNDDIVLDGDVLVINLDGVTYQFSISFDKDYDKNSIVNMEDVFYITDVVSTINSDYNITDISSVDYIVNNNTYDLEEDSINIDYVDSSVNIDNEYYVSEELNYEYSLDVSDIDERIVIDGYINYDSNIIKLNSISLIEGELIYSIVTNDNYFIFIIDASFSSIIKFNLNFNVISSANESIITLSNINLSARGILLNTTSIIESNFNAYMYGIGGDSDSSNEDDDTSTNKSTTTISNNTNYKTYYSNTSYTNNTNYEQDDIIAEVVSLNNDTSIKNIIIDGYDLDFKTDVYEYYLNIDSETESLDLDIILNTSSSTYYISGNDSLKEGENNVVITVLAEDGSTGTYLIRVNKSSTTSDEEDSNDSNNSFSYGLGFICGILIVLIIFTITYIKKRIKL